MLDGLYIKGIYLAKTVYLDKEKKEHSYGSVLCGGEVLKVFGLQEFKQFEPVQVLVSARAGKGGVYYVAK